MMAFFPASIDRLAPESSAIMGELPSVVEAGAGKDPLMRLFEDGSSTSGACHSAATVIVPWQTLVYCANRRRMTSARRKS